MIIGLSGYAGVGKDTLANYIVKLDPSFKIKKFSGKLKIIAEILTGIPAANFESQELKNKSLEGWDTWAYKARNDGDDVFPKYNGEPYRKAMTVRELLQKLGTDAIRDNLHEDAWVNALFCDYHQNENWIITDMRFPNEYDAVKKFGGMTVRLWRPNINPVNYHESEVALDNHAFDYIASNDGKEEDWKEAAEGILMVSKIK